MRELDAGRQAEHGGFGARAGEMQCIWARMCLFRGITEILKLLSPSLFRCVSLATSAKVSLASAAIHLTLPFYCEQRALFMFGG